MKSQLRPTFNLTQAEEMFFLLIKNDKYKDNKFLYKSLVVSKKEFLKKKIGKIEEKIMMFKHVDYLKSIAKEPLEPNEKDQKIRSRKESMLLRSQDLRSQQSFEHSFNLSRISNNGGHGKRRKKPKSKKDEKKARKQRELVYIDQNGQFRRRTGKVEGKNIFSDLNYGDVAMVFQNPLFDFMVDERMALEKCIINFDSLRKRAGKKAGKMDRDQAEKDKEKDEKIFMEREKRIKQINNANFTSMGFILETEKLAEEKKEFHKRVKSIKAVMMKKKFIEFNLKNRNRILKRRNSDGGISSTKKIKPNIQINGETKIDSEIGLSKSSHGRRGVSESRRSIGYSSRDVIPHSSTSPPAKLKPSLSQDFDRELQELNNRPDAEDKKMMDKYKIKKPKIGMHKCPSSSVNGQTFTFRSKANMLKISANKLIRSNKIRGELKKIRKKDLGK